MVLFMVNICLLLFYSCFFWCLNHPNRAKSRVSGQIQGPDSFSAESFTFAEFQCMKNDKKTLLFYFIFQAKLSMATCVQWSVWMFSRYVGNPIDCVHTKDIPEDVLNTYCWIHSTYTIPSAFWKRVGLDVAHPGIDKTIDPEERRYVKYYQWVCFCLFFQVGTISCLFQYHDISWTESISLRMNVLPLPVKIEPFKYSPDRINWSFSSKIVSRCKNQSRLESVNVIFGIEWGKKWLNVGY